MLAIEQNTVSTFVTNFLNSAMFNDLPGEQFEDLKDFLINYIYNLYNSDVDNIISLIDQFQTINPFMIKLALSYGLLEEDVVDLVRILFMKINEYFYKQGSSEMVENLTRVFDFYGLDATMYKVIYNKIKDVYILENIETGEQKIAEEKEIYTPGHLVSKENYFSNVFIDNYDTIVVYIEIKMYAYVTDEMQHPVSLLHAYSISLHRNDIVHFYVDGDTYDLTLQNFLDFLRYYYLQYLNYKYQGNFKIDEDPQELWNLFITNDSDLDASEELLSDFLSGEYMSREGLAYFLRTSGIILNKYQFNSAPKNLQEIHDHVYQLNSRLTDAIDNINSTEDFAYNISITMIYYQDYISTLPNSAQLEQYVQKTLLYLFMFVMMALLVSLDKQIHQLIFKYKRYYLPIYTQFFFKEIKMLKIKNDFYRIFVEDEYQLDWKIHASGLIYIQDKQYIELSKNELNYIADILDSVMVVVNPQIKDKNLKFTDKFYNYIDTTNKDNSDPNDEPVPTSELSQSDNTDILDSVIVTITQE